ncbi:MAG: hypothetical protein LC104_05185 [Bacteroidales bacterium]|nr:hypothetical protein [Bacteroidales bacterium]
MFDRHSHPIFQWRCVAGWCAVLFVLLILTPAAMAGDLSPVPAGGSGLWASRYWDGFVKFWTDAFRKQNGVVLFVLGAGALSIFIITRGKKLK